MVVQRCEIVKFVERPIWEWEGLGMWIKNFGMGFAAGSKGG